MSFSQVEFARVSRRTGSRHSREPWFGQAGRVLMVEDTDRGEMVHLAFENGDEVLFYADELQAVTQRNDELRKRGGK